MAEAKGLPQHFSQDMYQSGARVRADMFTILTRLGRATGSVMRKRSSSYLQMPPQSVALEPLS